MGWKKTKDQAVQAQADAAKELSDRREKHWDEVTAERLRAQRKLNGKADGDK
jgi:hypothetical protein